jgi:hypothetical protein
MRRLGINIESQGHQACGMRILRGDPMSPPRNVHGGRVVETQWASRGDHYTTGVVNADETSWSRPIGTAYSPT